jgi:hypothetical protein
MVFQVKKKQRVAVHRTLLLTYMLKKNLKSSTTVGGSQIFLNHEMV